jgi:hypothetical protein
MRMLDAIREIFTTLTNTIAAQSRASDFSCGDCERHERCGLPPSKDCIVRAEQIARDGEKPIRRGTLIPY